MSAAPESIPAAGLPLASRRVIEAEEICQRQVALIEHLRTHRHDIVEAEELLAKLQGTLALMRRLQQQLTAKEPKTP